MNSASFRRAMKDASRRLTVDRIRQPTECFLPLSRYAAKRWHGITRRLHVAHQDDPPLPEDLHVGSRAVSFRQDKSLVKVFYPFSDGLTSFETEVRFAKRLSSDYDWAPRLQEVGELWYRREYYRKVGKAPSSRSLRRYFASRLLSILLDLYCEGVAHRDFHLGNVFEDAGTLKLVDYEHCIEYDEWRSPHSLKATISPEGASRLPTRRHTLALRPRLRMRCAESLEFRWAMSGRTSGDGSWERHLSVQWRMLARRFKPPLVGGTHAQRQEFTHRSRSRTSMFLQVSANGIVVVASNASGSRGGTSKGVEYSTLDVISGRCCSSVPSIDLRLASALSTIAVKSYLRGELRR